jgi:hypothetical protein
MINLLYQKYLPSPSPSDHRSWIFLAPPLPLLLFAPAPDVAGIGDSGAGAGHATHIGGLQ